MEKVLGKGNWKTGKTKYIHCILTLEFQRKTEIYPGLINTQHACSRHNNLASIFVSATKRGQVEVETNPFRVFSVSFPNLDNIFKESNFQTRH